MLWARAIRNKTSAHTEVYVYFKHEEGGERLEFTRMFLDAFAT